MAANGTSSSRRCQVEKSALKHFALKMKPSRVKLPAINPKYPSRMPNVSTNKEFSGKNKLSFPPMPAERKSEAVNLSKLIGNGYGTDWFQQCTGCEKKIQKTSENSEQSKEPLPLGEHQKKTGKQKTRSVLLFRRKTAIKLWDEA